MTNNKEGRYILKDHNTINREKWEEYCNNNLWRYLQHTKCL